MSAHNRRVDDIPFPVKLSTMGTTGNQHKAQHLFRRLVRKNQTLKLNLRTRPTQINGLHYVENYWMIYSTGNLVGHEVLGDAVLSPQVQIAKVGKYNAANYTYILPPKENNA